MTAKYKGKTVMNERERYESLRHCKWVDEIIEDAPWVVDMDFLENHNIDYVAHDDLPYSDASGQSDDVYDFVFLNPSKDFGKVGRSRSRRQANLKPLNGRKAFQPPISF